jgi:hypothetical protein
MAQVGKKNQNLVPVSFNPVGGLNLAVPPHAIAEHEMAQCNNWIYMPHSGQIAVRPGFSMVTQVAGPGAILNMHSFKGDLICSVSDGKVYVYNFAADSFTSIHDISAAPVAMFLTFNNKLLIVDGGGLFSWEGGNEDVVEVITTFHPTAIIEIGNRVVINDKQDMDAVYLSGPEDETDWDTSSGAAVGLRAGFGDGMNVNGFAVLGTDLIVSKAGNGQKFIYRISIAGPSSNWAVHKLVTDTSARSETLIDSVPNTILYVNEDSELRSLEGVQEYGDIRMMNAGEKINPMLASVAKNGFPASMIRYSPAYDMLVIIFSGVVAFFNHASKRFTTMDFDAGDLRCCCDYSDELFWGSQNGNIYRWNESSDTDEVSHGVTEHFEANIKSKVFAFPGEALVKKSTIATSNFVQGTGTVRINHVKVIDFEILGSPWYLFDADDTQLADANMPLYERGEADTIKKSHNKCRQKDFYIHITVPEGRCGLNYVNLEVAQVAG